MSKASQNTTIAIIIVAILIVLGYILYVLQGDDDSLIYPDEEIEREIDETNDDVVAEEQDSATLEEVLAMADEENDNITIEVTDDTITITTNSLPDHETGEFPNDGNPNTIEALDAVYVIDRNPTYTESSTPVKVFGITLGGVQFDPGTAEKDAETGASIEAIQELLDLGLDFNNAHVQPGGKYHYHGIPTSLVTSDSSDTHSHLVGFAADGFPVYVRYGHSDPKDASSAIKEYVSSWVQKEGQRASNEPSGEYDGTYTLDFEYKEGAGDLDDCNGIFTVTPEYPEGTYAYFLTDTFPFVPRCLHGDSDGSFETAVPDQGPPGGGAGLGPRP